jgi:hypothetical protein
LIPKCEHTLKSGKRCQAPSLQNHNKCRHHNSLSYEELIARHPGPQVRAKSKPADHIIRRRNFNPAKVLAENPGVIKELPREIREVFNSLSISIQGQLIDTWMRRQELGWSKWHHIAQVAKDYAGKFPHRPGYEGTPWNKK